MYSNNPIKNQDAKEPRVKVWIQEVSIGPDAKDPYAVHGPCIQIKVPANARMQMVPNAKGLMTKGSGNSPAAKCLNAKGPGCMESVCKKSGFKSSPKKSSCERSGFKKMECELQMY